MKLESLSTTKRVLPNPLETYETTLLWSGTVCYNTHKKTGRRLFANMHIEEVPYPLHLSRIDHTEKVTVVVYSVSPAIWSENDDLFVTQSKTSCVRR